jgi:hypothetical protein
VWANEEIDALIDVWRAEDIEGQLAGLHRNLPVYARVAELLAIKGYDRSHEQCRTKMKHLRGEYMKDNNINGRSGHSRLGSRVFDLLEDILRHQPIANPEQIVATAALGLQVNAGNMIDVDSHGSDHDDLGNGDLDRALPM